MTASLLSRRSGITLAALSLASLTACIPAAAAPTTAVSFDSSSLNAVGPQFSLGFTFTVGADALNVTSVGYLNDGATGANAIHQVQFYQITSGDVANPTAGTAVLASPASVTTTGGSAANNTFSFAALASPVTLMANKAYEIVANDNGNGAGANAVNSVFSGITYGNATFKYASTPDFNPNTFTNNNIGHFGPNFQYGAPSPVPEASSMVGFGLMLVLGGVAAAAKRKKTA